MISFDAPQWVVIVGLLVITNVGTWFMSMHFTMAREIRRQLVEKKENIDLSKTERRRRGKEKNTLGQIKNGLTYEYFGSLSYELVIPTEKEKLSELRVFDGGIHVASVFCDAQSMTLTGQDHIKHDSWKLSIERIEEMVEWVHNGLMSWTR